MSYIIPRDRRTNADIAFDHLEDDILSLRLKPGTKISEAEIAAHLGLSRQPVREAFGRLQHANLLHVQPQRATTVRKFSLDRIAAGRFLRRAIELEVLRDAVALWDGTYADAFTANLDAQAAAVAASDQPTFQRLDFAFHHILCRAAQADHAFAQISALKTGTTRLCALSLSREKEIDDLLQDHAQIFQAVSAKDLPAAEHAIRKHLSRLDQTVAEVHAQHSDYFEA